MSLRQAVEAMFRAGARRFYAKPLAPNDNSKNQVYLGGSLASINLLPVREIVPDDENPQRLKAPLDLRWLTDAAPVRAPNAQLILYPEYPEVRLSGFLLGAKGAPSALMASRLPGRVLLLGVCADGSIVAIALGPEDPATHEFIAKKETFPLHGVLFELPSPAEGDGDGFETLVTKLSDIHHKDWIRSWSLNGEGIAVPCEAPQCGGYTLEAELGVRRNGRSEPDFLGWEVKAFDVPSLERESPGGKALTLMTPEPTGALYQDDFSEFWARYSYEDKAGRAGRRNFGGIYRCGAEPHAVTGLRLALSGFNGKGFDGNGQLALVDREERVAASWSFASLLEKWSKKHRRAIYVPFETGLEPRRYRFGANVSLGRGTDFVRLLRAVSAGSVYLDPAIKSVEGRFKRRNQFRVARRDLDSLYDSYENLNVDSGWSN